MVELVELEDVKLYCDFKKLEYRSHRFVDHQGVCDGRVFIICIYQGVEIEVEIDSHSVDYFARLQKMINESNSLHPTH